jgi:hypothetical protein
MFSEVATKHPESKRADEARLRVDDCLYDQARYAEELAYLVVRS